MTENERVQNPTICDNLSQDETIQRCPHDNENPYTMILNELIRDASISPNCRWLLIYLLSNSEGWRINIRQVVNHLKGQIGRNAVYAIFDEAISAGYIKKEAKKSGNLNQGYVYYVSERPKFKNILRHPENQDAEAPNPENGHYKKQQEKEEIYKSNNIDNVQCTDVQDNVSVNVDASAHGNSMLEKMQKAHKWMTDNGCENDLAKFIVNKYDIADIANASIYLMAQIAKPKFEFKKPKWAYFQSILKNRWWEKPQI